MFLLAVKIATRYEDCCEPNIPSRTLYTVVAEGETEMRSCGNRSYRYLTDDAWDARSDLFEGWESVEVLAPENADIPTNKEHVRLLLEGVQAAL
jgi:hypothetical protein